MRNPNVRILLIAAVLIAAVAAAAALLPKGTTGGTEAAQNAQGYLRIQVGDEIWPLVPLADGGEYVVEQGSGVKNVIHTTATSAVMHSSTCDNQNCVDQGVVSLENRSTRVLGGLIVCLPNEVILEVLSPDETGAN